jgi:hypothetical protein
VEPAVQSDSVQNRCVRKNSTWLPPLTDAGFDIVHLAAPTHLRSVRRIVLDSLNATDQKALIRIAQKLRIVPDDFG